MALRLGVQGAEVIEVALGGEVGDLADAVALEMAKRGDGSALPALKERLALPGGADALLYRLAEVKHPDLWDGVPEVLASTLSDDDLVWLIRNERDVPWASWADAHPRIGTAVDASSARPSAAAAAPPPAADVSIAELLEAGWSRPLPRRLRHRFRTALSPLEVDLIRKAATGPGGYRRALALQALAERRDPFAIPTATQVFAENTIGVDRAAAVSYINALDPRDTLPLARTWISSDDDRAGVAAGIFALHGQAEDLPLVRTALAAAWEEHYIYGVCSLVDALGRHPEHGPFPELVGIYSSIEYSYGRGRAVRVLADSDPAFAEIWATECLWDCESDVRGIGVGRCLITAASRDRLNELAEDPWEESAVRASATARLVAAV